VAGNSPKRDELVSYFHELSPYIFIPFFTQVGLQLNLPVLINSLGFSIVASLVRAFCMFLGTTTGGHMVNMDQDKALRLWMGLLPQAGVALGLAGIVGHQFNSSFGKSFQSTVLGVILVNQCIGPVFAKILIKYCQEDGKSKYLFDVLFFLHIASSTVLCDDDADFYRQTSVCARNSSYLFFSPLFLSIRRWYGRECSAQCN